MDFSPDLIKGNIATLLLSLLSRHGDLYGYQLAQRLSEETDGRISPGQSTLYPALHAMEGQGWVEAYWTEADGRKRKYYALTAAGHLELARRRTEWQEFQRTLNAVFGMSG